METVVSDSANLEANRKIHDYACCKSDPQAIADELCDPKRFYTQYRDTYSDWVALYWDDLASRLKGSRVLELGPCAGRNAVLMASMGAHVTTIDIAEHSETLIGSVAKLLGLASAIDTVTGDVCSIELPDSSFDFVVAQGFLHHLTHRQENTCLQKVARWLKADGEARFAETAENNPIIDKLRWYIPLAGRPSCLCKESFAAYRQINQSHPPRDNSSRHYYQVGRRYFEDVSVLPAGGLERFHRLFARSPQFESKFRRFALRQERWLPSGFHLWIARYQTVILRRPKKAAPMRRP